MIRFLFLFILSFNIFADAKVHSRKCGEFIIIEETHLMETVLCQTNQDSNTDDSTYKTPNSKLTIVPSEELLSLTHKSQKILDYVLYEKVLEKVKERFDETFEFAKSSNEPELLDALTKARESILSEKKVNPRNEIRKFLALFPEIENELIKENPEYKPLLCQYEAWKHREKFLRRFSRVLGIIGTVAGISGIIAASMLNIPMLPVAFYALSVVKMTSGTLKMRNAVATWSDVQTAKVAKKMIRVFDEAKDQLDDLEKHKKTLLKEEKSPAITQEIKETEEKIKSLSLALDENKKLMKDLKKDVKAGKTIKRELVSGILDTTIGAFALWGGNIASNQLKDFYPKESQIKTIPLDPKGDGSLTPFSPGDVQGPGTNYVDP